MTATVTAQDGSLPTGNVDFFVNGLEFGTATLNNSGVAVLTISTLAGGTDTLLAMYEGSPTLRHSPSPPVTQVVNLYLSSTTVTSSPNPSTFGQPVAMTATVAPSGPLTPTGTVDFASNGVAIEGCTAIPLSLVSQTAVCMTSTLAVGTDTVVATYSGEYIDAGSNGMFSQIVNPVPSPVQFVPVTPCRVVDTRNPSGAFDGPAIRLRTPRATFHSRAPTIRAAFPPTPSRTRST